MNLANPAFLQIGIDLALLAAILFLLWRINVGLKNPLIKSNKDMLKELKVIVRESQAASDAFLQTMEQSRLAIKQLAMELDLKEKRVKTLLDTSASGMSSESAGTQTKYAEVVDMISRGISREQAAQATGFTEAEIGLILDLYRVKQETG
ncbi:MAG: hypothetical protein R6W75_07280 [Smithellaceae bacterium]